LARPGERDAAPAQKPAALLARRSFGLLALIALTLTGCAVPQPRGDGKLERLEEPTTGRGYWLYLPKTYVQSGEDQRAERRWPIVVTFHGMKPFDGAHAQACEWEQEADRFGFVVIAPELAAPDVLRQFPLREVTPALKEDERASVAIVHTVASNTHADATNVLATSWSSGGYMAHYMLNRHPEVFTCLGVRQSNFSASVLDPAMTAQSQQHPILILNTENDFAVCVKESREAIQWYESHGYRHFAWLTIKALGHERTPDIAAAFFGQVAGVKPMWPQEALVQRQAIDGNPTALALLAGKAAAFGRPALADASRSPVGTRASAPPAPPPTQQRPVTLMAQHGAGWDTAGPDRPPVRTDSVRAVSASASKAAPANAPKSTPPRGPSGSGNTPNEAPLSIWLSSAVANAPLLLEFTPECPADWQRTADFVWTLNGRTIATGIEGVTTIAEPGEYTLGLLVVTSDGGEHWASRKVRVLASLEAHASKR
jgi:poly(3-hydroxybutyrate) depolymerase